MFDFGPGYLENASEVEERFVRQYLLPLLGYTPATWAEEVLIGSRSGLQRLTARLLPFSSPQATPYLLVIHAKSPKQRLEPYVSQLRRQMVSEEIEHGVLLNGKELRLYRRTDRQIELLFTCAGHEVAANAERLRSLIGRQVFTPEAQEQSSSDYDVRSTPFPSSITDDSPESTSPTGGGTTHLPPAMGHGVSQPVTSQPVTSQPFTASDSGDQPAGVPRRTHPVSSGAQPPLSGGSAQGPGAAAVPPPVSVGLSSPIRPPTEPPTNQPESMQPERKTDPMKVIAIYHNKGGVGKTTVTVNLAAALRNRGYRVLLIDLDSQANSTFATGLVKFQFDEDDNLRDNNIYHVLESGDFHSIPEVVRSSNLFHQPEIHVLPSHISLIEGQYKLNQIKASQTRLIKKLREVEDDYDFVLIDTPPSRDIYAQVAIIAANYLIIPSDLKPFANQGLTSVHNFIKEIDEFRESMGRPTIHVLGVLPSKMSTNKFAFEKAFPRQKEKITGHYGFPVMDTVIFERVALSHAVNQTNDIGDLEIPDPKSIFVYAQNNNSATPSAAEFDALAEEVLRKVA